MSSDGIGFGEEKYFEGGVVVRARGVRVIRTKAYSPLDCLGLPVTEPRTFHSGSWFGGGSDDGEAIELRRDDSSGVEGLEQAV